MVAAALLLLGTVVALLRQGGAAVTDTLWAEDGSQFLEAAYTLPLHLSLGETYSGYLHL